MNTLARIVFLDRATLPARIELRTPDYALDVVSFAATAPHEVAARIADADTAITNKVSVRAELRCPASATTRYTRYRSTRSR